MSEDIVKGLGDLNKFLDQLPARMEKNFLRGAVRAGAKVPMAEIKQTVPVETVGKHPGALRDSIKLTTSARAGIVKATVKVGGKKAYWAGWVEKGTKPHDIKPKRLKSLFFAGLARMIVHHPGAKAKPFAGPALRNNVQASVNAMGAYLRARFTKAGIDVPGPENY